MLLLWVYHSKNPVIYRCNNKVYTYSAAVYILFGDVSNHNAIYGVMKGGLHRLGN